MNDAELRAFIRQSVRRHMEPGHPPVPRVSEMPLTAHPSHGLLQVFSDQSAGGPCLIEPDVTCEHCRFCRSFGH